MRRGQNALTVSDLASCWVFSEWRRGKHGSERVKPAKCTRNPGRTRLSKQMGIQWRIAPTVSRFFLKSDMSVCYFYLCFVLFLFFFCFLFFSQRHGEIKVEMPKTSQENDDWLQYFNVCLFVFCLFLFVVKRDRQTHRETETERQTERGGREREREQLEQLWLPESAFVSPAFQYGV